MVLYPGCFYGFLCGHYQFLDWLSFWNQCCFGSLHIFCIHCGSNLPGDYNWLGYWCCNYDILDHYFYCDDTSCWDWTDPWAPKDTCIGKCFLGIYFWQLNGHSKNNLTWLWRCFHIIIAYLCINEPLVFDWGAWERSLTSQLAAFSIIKNYFNPLRLIPLVLENIPSDTHRDIQV